MEAAFEGYIGTGPGAAGTARLATAVSPGSVTVHDTWEKQMPSCRGSKGRV